MKLKLKRRYLLLPTLLLSSMLTAACTDNNQVGNNNHTNSANSSTSPTDNNSSNTDGNTSVGNGQTKLTDDKTGDTDPVDKHNTYGETGSEKKTMDPMKKNPVVGSDHMNDSSHQAESQPKKEAMEGTPNGFVPQGTTAQQVNAEKNDQKSKIDNEKDKEQKQESEGAVTDHASESITTPNMDQGSETQKPAKPVVAGTSSEPNASQKSEMHS